MIRSDSTLRTVPVVVLTGNEDARLVQTALLEGANSCVLKPIDPDEFESSISAIAEFWLGSNLVAPPPDRAIML